MGIVETTLRWEELSASGRPASVRVAILASFTANPVVPCLGVALEDEGLPAEILVGPYDQIAQECLSDGATARFRPSVLVCWPRLEELWRGGPLPLEPDPRHQQPLLELADLALAAARRWQARLVFVLPAVPDRRPLGAGDASHPHGLFATATAAREAVRARLAAGGALIFDLEEVVREVGAPASYNERLFALARIPFSQALFDRAGQGLARLLRLAWKPARKVLVLDGDNTLWGGVVGEEGPAGVDLRESGPGAAFRQLQAFLLELRRAGLLLALASKNDEADVWAVFARPEMVLKQEQLSAWRIGWQPKSQSLREIAGELGVGVDSLVFLDDNPAELAEVQAAWPGVACLRMPEDPALWPAALAEGGLLDRLPPTDEDRRRAGFYQEERRRDEQRARAGSLDEYLAGLDVEVALADPGPADLTRLGQLVQKTNQFNLNQRRRSEAELRDLCADDRYRVRLVSARDRFGDYGLVGAFVVELAGCELDSFLLSCRAMGRGIEEAMVADACELVSGPLRATLLELPRNEPARRFFAGLGCTPGVSSPLRQQGWPSHVARR